MLKRIFKRKEKENKITICVDVENVYDMSCFFINYMNEEDNAFSLRISESHYFISVVTKLNAMELSDLIKEKVDNVRYILVLDNNLVVYFN